VSSLFYFLIIKSMGTNAAGGAYTTGLMWCPAIGALLTCKYLGRSVASLGWQWGETRYQVFSYLIPLGYAALVYSIAWSTGLAGLNPKQTPEVYANFFGLGPMHKPLGIALYFLVVATTGVIENCATTLGEEIGWRGFLVPELARRFSFTATALLSGVIWAAWHVPIIVFGGYNQGTPVWYGLTVAQLRAHLAAVEVREPVDRRPGACLEQPLHPALLRPHDDGHRPHQIHRRRVRHRIHAGSGYAGRLFLDATRRTAAQRRSIARDCALAAQFT
jgi:membrane protease YdiL (CAAX protease family)